MIDNLGKYYRRRDLTGQRFKTYTVVELTGKNRFGALLWKCKCDCGLEAIHQSGNIVNGSIRCKCQNLPTGESGFRELYRNYQRDSGKRGYDFQLERDSEFRRLVTGNCVYCGDPPNQEIDGFKYNGIDRINNAIGYVTDNVVSCCGDCNLTKHIRSRTEFLNRIERIYKHCIASNPVSTQLTRNEV